MGEIMFSDSGGGGNTLVPGGVLPVTSLLNTTAGDFLLTLLNSYNTSLRLPTTSMEIASQDPGGVLQNTTRRARTNWTPYLEPSITLPSGFNNTTYTDPSLYSSPEAVFATLVTFSFLTIFGNSLVIIAVFREHYLKSPPNYFVASLAAADISVGLLLIPFEAITQLLNRRWIFGPIWCELWHSFDVLLSTASILNLCVISLDRYWAICTPMSYPRRMTTRKACKFIALVWILAILISMPAIFWWRSVRTMDIPSDKCFFTEDVGYLISSSCISFYIPLAVMLFAYFKIYKADVRQSRSIQAGAKLFTPHDKSRDTGEMTLRMHRGGCCAEDGNNPPNHRKSFSFGRADSTGVSLLGCKRTHSVRIHMDRDRVPQDHRRFTESGYFSAAGIQQESGIAPDMALEPVPVALEIVGGNHSPPYLPVPLVNNNYGGHRHSTSAGMNYRRRQSRRSFTMAAKKLAKFAKEKKAAKTLAIVLGVFIICWLPFFVLNVVFAICKKCADGHLKLFEVVTWLGWINSAMNPVIYACWSPDLRRAFARLLGCARCVRARQRRKTQRRLSVV